jgi:predicted 2-oxoglutarate/Fe(II)-dependent dioxygenase YbiX/peroxiredoxin
MPLPAWVPAPYFTTASPTNPQYALSSLGGLYLVLVFLPEPGPERDAALAVVEENRSLLSEDRVVLFGLLPDAASFATARNTPPWRWLSDLDGAIRQLYQVTRPDGGVDPHVVVVDPSMRIMGSAPLDQFGKVMNTVGGLGAPQDHAGVELHAPVLIVPRVFEPKLCQRLIAYYQQQGGTPSGVMRVVDGKTVGVLDDFKKRKDAIVTDPELLRETRARLNLRLKPELEKAFQYTTEVVERFLVARYDAEDGGYFRAHRDNTTPGTAHRRFAVSINLNAEEFEGGDLRFAEFGPKTYRPPTGGAVVFSCSLLHEATPVTKGTRYAFLPFLYDRAAAKIREQNMHTFEPPAEAAETAPNEV